MFKNSHIKFIAPPKMMLTAKLAIIALVIPLDAADPIEAIIAVVDASTYLNG
jgi:hypothetical protein